MAANSPLLDPNLNRAFSLSAYPSPHEHTPPQKIIGIISIIALTIFLSIASFYNAQLTFAIINTGFFTVLGGSIIYSLLTPSVNVIPASHAPLKPRRSRAYSCPYRRVSQIKDGGEDGWSAERPKKTERPHSPLNAEHLAAGKFPYSAPAIRRFRSRLKTYHPHLLGSK